MLVVMERLELQDLLVYRVAMAVTDPKEIEEKQERKE